MKPKIKLDKLQVKYNGSTELKDFKSKSKFNDSLQDFPLDTIKSICLKYTVNKNIVLDLFIIPASNMSKGNWQVNFLDYNFSFLFHESFNPHEFVQIFENKLNQKLVYFLENRNSLKFKDAQISMDGRTIPEKKEKPNKID